MMIKG